MTETPYPYGSAPQADFESQYRRVFEAAECRTQVALAELLEIKQSSISDAKRRKSIPSDWRVKLFEKKRVNPEWILYGEGTKYLISADEQQGLPHVVRVTEVRPPQECSAQELFNELVRRAMSEPNIEAIRKDVAASWFPVKKPDDES
ncbi:helix-turn-helix domain containing protein [Desulfovibrio sp. OttesenSCG-928-G11]|nr:helix-turn-helix domain containing protein [Desulfovibrio sp. OttesenSCG-928-G11]